MIILILRSTMKNTRYQAPPSHLSIASKRHSLNPDRLTQPYKVDWSVNPHLNPDTKNNHNKNFFQNMKSQLSSIKNDFQKLIKKENSFTSTQKRPHKQEQFYSTGMGAQNKGKSMTSYKKEARKINYDKSDNVDRADLVLDLQDLQGKYRKKFYQINKHQSFTQKKPAQSAANIFEKEQFQDRSIQKISAKIPDRSVEQQNTILSRQAKWTTQHERGMRQKIDENDKLKEKIRQMSVVIENGTLSKLSLQKQIQKQREENNKLFSKISGMSQQFQSKAVLTFEQQKRISELSGQVQKLSEDKRQILDKMSDLSEQLQRKLQQISNQQRKVFELSSQLSEKQSINSQSNISAEQAQNQRLFYEQRINQLIFHNQNFHKINSELGAQNQQIKDNMANLHNYIEHLKRTHQSSQNDYLRKMDFMKADIEQYDKRQTMFAKEIDSLSLQIQQLVQQQEERPQQSYEDSRGEGENEGFIEQLNFLRRQVNMIKDELETQKQKNEQLKNKYESELGKLNLQGFASELQTKMNELVEQNGSLKTKINTLQADLDSLREQNGSYKKEIHLYEERDKVDNSNQQLTSNEYEQLMDTIDQLTQEKGILVEKIELLQLKRQTEIQGNSNRCQQNESIIKMAHTQLQEIQKLKGIVRDLKQQNQFLRSQLQTKGRICMQLKEKQKDLLKGNQTKYSAFKHEVQRAESKDRQIAALKQMLFKYLIEKQGKGEFQGEGEYFITKLQELKPLLIGDQ